MKITKTQQVYWNTMKEADRLLEPLSQLADELHDKGENTDDILRVLHLLQEVRVECLCLAEPVEEVV
jgi:hypothetical protein